MITLLLSIAALFYLRALDDNDRRMPTRRQRAQWRRERLEFARRRQP